MYYDVFNGDADGIFALHQYRLENPVPDPRLITGTKRDVRLLSQLDTERDGDLTVFDISLDSNRDVLLKLLDQQNRIVYFDHHFAGDIPPSPFLATFIDPAPDTCTSLIINSLLGEKYHLWAICGAFGDNLHQVAGRLAKKHGLSGEDTELLRELGELVNYNGYGETVHDLHFHPRDLYRAIAPFISPFDFLENSTDLAALRRGYREDLAQAMQVKKLATTGNNRVYLLPDAVWARRVNGVFSNLRARERSGSAHAVLTHNEDGSLRVSVRAPLDDRRDADTLCKLFPTGGGRAAAAGINSLPEAQLDLFLEKFYFYYP